MNNDYHRIERAIRFIRKNVGDQPSLQVIAAHVGLSPYHFQRLFRQWVGISPKRYLEFLTVEHSKWLLSCSRSVMQTAYDVGLSGPSRLHEQFVCVQATTPGEFKNRGEGVEIRYGIHTGPFGDMFIAQTQRGLCLLSFVNHTTADAELDRLKRWYSKARYQQDINGTAVTVQRIFQSAKSGDSTMHLAVRGTNFQINVWRALLRIPYGHVISYQQLACEVGRPDAVRAVANAVAANPINVLIPCHRVLRASGEIGGFRGGTEIKKELLAWEAYSIESEQEASSSAVDAAVI
jgi:AraC family transcriptional regulator of adaptative response/methylated-DNA-[protein]-cysteine methyltransferase